MNQVNLIGRITLDPELRTTANGTKVTSFNLAVNGMKDSNGNQRTDFIPITIWNKQAENLCKFLKKGDQLGVSGRIQTSHYEDKDGNRRMKIEVVGTTIHFLGACRKEDVQTTINEEEEVDDLVLTGDVDDDELPF